MNKRNLIFSILILYTFSAIAQTDTAKEKEKSTDTAKVTKFDKFNKKMEKLFKVIPVPIISYSTDAGNTLGLAKFNLINLSKKDTISKPSKISGVFTFSDKGRINASIATELIFNENRNMILAYVNYKKTPEYIYGIGNDVTREGQEEVISERFKFSATILQRIDKKFLYAGPVVDYSNYFKIDFDSNGYLYKNSYPGINGGASVGVGIGIAHDSRSNRYNPQQGTFILGSFVAHPEFLGSKYDFTKFNLDVRHYFNPWLKHIIAVQATTTATYGDVPFYELALMGGDSKMRGYYEGAYRDKVLLDGQVEYRLPVWNIFGVVGWVGTGRVADYYGNLGIKGFHMSYGWGVRIKVDSKNNTNLRVDFGYGPGGLRGTYINFAEAF